MYVIDARHYLNDQGVIAVQKGPARKMADFVTAVVAHASGPHLLQVPQAR